MLGVCVAILQEKCEKYSCCCVLSIQEMTTAENINNNIFIAFRLCGVLKQNKSAFLFVIIGNVVVGWKFNETH